jgi:hypothetical protein
MLTSLDLNECFIMKVLVFEALRNHFGPIDHNMIFCNVSWSIVVMMRGFYHNIMRCFIELSSFLIFFFGHRIEMIFFTTKLTSKYNIK